MATIKEQIYTAWEFTDDEEPLAKVFTDLQYKHIQTELAIVANQKALLAYDPTTPQAFTMESEYMRGQIDAFRLLLGMSDAKKTALQTFLETNQPQD